MTAIAHMATCPSCRKRYPEGVTTCEVDGDGLLPDEAFTGVDADLSTGQMVGEYRIEQKIGEGGFGSVYKAVHPLIGKTAAIKLLNRQYSSNPQMVTRFIAEARAVNQIRHRNIVDIFAFGALADGRQYYLMELLEGTPLDRYIESKGRLTPEEAIPILRAIGRALDAAHATGIAHRDLKPENIFLSFDEEGAIYPKLLDFGIAKLLANDASTSDAGSAKTRTGTPMGTPYYMSPEQCRGKDVDHRTDIYSFGVMIFLMLTGKLPFDGDSVMDLMIKQSTMPAPAMSSVCPEVPAALDAPVLQMMEKLPELRPTSIGAALDVFTRAAAAAGFAVVVPAAASNPRGPYPIESGPPRAVDSTIGHAKTLPTPTPPLHLGTFRGAASEVDASPRRRTAMLLALGACILVVGAGTVVALTSTKKPPAIAERDPIAYPPPQTSVAAIATTAAGGVTSAAPEAPALVQITVRSTPERATIYLGEEKLGTAPGPVKLPRGDAKVKLTIKADGFSPSDIEVEPTDNTIVSIKLSKVAITAKPTTVVKRPHSEIEDPFK